MKLFKTKTILTVLLFGGMLLTHAQENARKGWDAPPPKSHISAGYGSTMPSSTTKDAFLNNSSGITLDYSLPLTKRGWGPNGNYLSLNVGGQYNFGGSDNPSLALPSGFAIAGQTSSSIAYKGVDPKNPGFFTFAGPQVNFILSNKFTISPMLLAGYFSTTQKELSAVQTTQYNGQTLEYKLVTLPETKTSGFALTPKIRMQYRLTKSLGLFADASYIFGPKVETQLSNLVPLGNQNQQGQYNQQQLEMGTYVKGETKTTSYTALGVNIGLSFAFGGDKGWNGVTKASDKGWNGITETKDKGWNGVKANNKYNEELLTELTRQNNSGTKEYYNSDKQDCSAKSGIECTDDISVSDDFDMDSFDKYVSSSDPQRIKDIFLKNDMKKFIIGLMSRPKANEIIESLKKGELTLKKIQTKDNSNSYQLGTPNGIENQINTVKIVLAKKHNYVGHVTLLR